MNKQDKIQELDELATEIKAIEDKLYELGNEHEMAEEYEEIGKAIAKAWEVLYDTVTVIDDAIAELRPVPRHSPQVATEPPEVDPITYLLGFIGTD
jgi:hypothetical protein